MIKEEPIYKYHLQTWGGFYNKEHQHGKKPGDFLFDTFEERRAYMSELQHLEHELDAKMLMMVATEGYACDTRTVLHRVVEWDKHRVYTEYDMGVNYPYEAARYHMEWKWTPGFNDYPFGGDFDYEENQVTIIQEWITGAFTIDQEY